MDEASMRRDPDIYERAGEMLTAANKAVQNSMNSRCLATRCQPIGSHVQVLQSRPQTDQSQEMAIMGETSERAKVSGRLTSPVLPCHSSSHAGKGHFNFAFSRKNRGSHGKSRGGNKGGGKGSATWDPYGPPPAKKQRKNGADSVDEQIQNFRAAYRG